MELKLTETELNSYWNEKATYFKQYSELYDKYVPRIGNDKTVNAELIRAISRLQYEYYNNGNGNACSGVRNGGKNMYVNFLRLIRENVINTKEHTKSIRTSFCESSSLSVELDYIHMMDKVIFHVMTSKEDKDLPKWYIDSCN